MNSIRFKNIIPNVFATRKEHNSDVWGKDLVFEKGKTYLVEAESGKGKSTFCSYVIGYRNDYTGQLLFDDTDVSTFGLKDWIRVRTRHVSLLFQDLRLFPELSAIENVEIKNRLTLHKSTQQIEQLFDMLSIADKKNVKTGLLSFGQQQRVAMIRALCQPFDFILLDEPVSHLDDNNADIMGRIMYDEAKQQGAGIIVTSIGKHQKLLYDGVINL